MTSPKPGLRANEETNDVRDAWIVGYRRDHPEADWWAEGVRTIEHGVETQERVFRMVEQLAAQGIDRSAAFAALRHADALVDAAGRGRPQVDGQAPHLYFEGRAVCLDDLRPGPWRPSLVAATAGCLALESLTGKRGTVVTLLRPEAFEGQLASDDRHWSRQAVAGRVMIVMDEGPPLDHLRACGFDPITFDGADPAAFAWAVLEITWRTEATVTELGCGSHPRFRPVPLGVAVNRSAGTSQARMQLASVGSAR